MFICTVPDIFSVPVKGFHAKGELFVQVMIVRTPDNAICPEIETHCYLVQEREGIMLRKQQPVPSLVVRSG